jgi:hypothetical protein
MLFIICTDYIRIQYIMGNCNLYRQSNKDSNEMITADKEHVEKTLVEHEIIKVKENRPIMNYAYDLTIEVEGENTNVLSPELPNDVHEASKRKDDLISNQVLQKGRLVNIDTINTRTPKIIHNIEAREGLSIVLNNIKSSITFDTDLIYPGTVELHDGTVYDGQWNTELKKHGFGTLIMKNGSKYVGSFINDFIHGKGYYIDIEGRLYVGEFSNGKANGKGKISIEDNKGYFYEGDFKDNEFDGHGQERFSDGSVYIGKFTNGYKEPYGKSIFDDNSSYEGEFRKGVIHGYGTFIWNDGKTYTGTFVDGKLQGKGKTTWPDGSFYEGEYKNDKFNGIGTFMQADGTIFKGKWVNNEVHGVGYFKDNQNEYKGIWRYNKNIMVLANGES